MSRSEKAEVSGASRHTHQAEGVLLEKLHALKKSRSGYVGTITSICNKIENSLKEFANVTEVRSLQTKLKKAWEILQANHEQYSSLVTDKESQEAKEAHAQYDAQRCRVEQYNERIDSFVADAATHFNEQVVKDFGNLRITSVSEVSGVSRASSKYRESRLAAAKATLLQEQAQERKRRAIENARKRMELEMRQREFELQQRRQQLQHELELAELDAEDNFLDAKNNAELAQLEASAAGQELASVLNGDREGIASTAADFTTVNDNIPATVTDAAAPPATVVNQVLPPASSSFAIPHAVRQGVTNPRFEDTRTFPTFDTNAALFPRVSPVSAPAQPTSESLLAMIVSTMEKISMSQDLPAIQIQKFDGSPERFPVFKQRFYQMVESKPLDESTKMTRLLQFLEGPALKAVRRYESVPGGLAKALEVLRDRFGRPCQIVRACVDSLTKGPAFAPSDKEGLRRFADSAHVMYDTLKAMGCLAEMNTENLERIILRLPKWAQGKFGEYLKRIEHEGRVMPTFKDVVIFLKDRADAANHPFFSKASGEITTTRYTKFKDKPTPFKTTTLSTSSDASPCSDLPDANSANSTNSANRTESCPMCDLPHALYRCEVFKSKSVRDRGEFVKRKRICFNCISSTKHTSRSCKSTVRCRIPGCGKPHHTLLHLTQPLHNREVTQDENHATATSSDDPPSGSCSTATTTESLEVLLQVVPLKVIANNGKAITTYGLIDSGSDVTMVDPSLTRQLNIEGEPGELFLSTVNRTGVQEEGMKVNFKIAPVDQDDHEVDVRGAWAVKELTIPLKHVSASSHIKQCPHLQHIPYPDVERRKISILIGTNIQEAFIPLEVKKGKPNEPLAIKCCLGWSVLGRCPSSNVKRQFNLNHVSHEVTLSRQLEEFWKVESYGTDKYEAKPLSVEDRKAVRIIENTITKLNGRYQVDLLWRRDIPSLPYNRVLAEARLQHLKRRLQRDAELEAKYRAVIEDYVTKGYARKMTSKEAAGRTNITWYLPHHPVLNPNKPGKVRVVFDAAAKFKGTSLNEQLLQGPDLTNSLPGVLIRFREEGVAFTADIEAMFHQTRVSPKDTDALRFLWWSSSIDDPPDEYQMLVHIFGATSSPCCANTSLRKTATDNEQNYDSEVIETVRRNFYVDDCLKSVPTTEQAIKYAEQLIKLLKEGGLRLTKFNSNCRDVLASIPAEERANPSMNLDLDLLPVERALGLHWNAETDTFQFKVVPANKPPTKRGILSVVSSLYDPLGFLSPFVLLVKVLLQELWRLKVQWDERIQDPYLTQWQRWIESLPYITAIRIPRCYKALSLTDALTNVQVHYFSDASKCGYAAVSYIRMVDDEGKIHCAFIMGKTRNAPMKGWSIPRLELQAAVLSARMHRLIREELDLPVNQSFFWSDSVTTLQYINNEKRRFQMFVANRVNEIHDVSSPAQWRHVPGALNPADSGSRGMKIRAFKPGCHWWNGPKFLWKPDDQWPVRHVAEVPENDEEVQAPSSVMSLNHGSPLDLFIRRYSSWPRLLVFMAWLLRYVKHIKKEEVAREGITLAEIRQATKEIIRLIQSQSFSEELNALQGKGQVKGHSKLANLSPTLIDGVIRVGGRIRNAPIPFNAMHPVILPKDHPVATLIVRHHHEILGHAGREHVLSAMRQHYWILQGRALVRRVLRQCVDCRKRNESAMQQMMADLPKERLTPYEPPFTYTGTDFFGPFSVKRGRGTAKVYGCIFVCFNSRAIHIEDVSSLETDTFIQALRRFMSIRGCPREIWSDNGTNFSGAEREIRRSIQEWDQEAIKGAMRAREVEWYNCPMPKWRFQPPTASHMNGVWERLIRSVRKSMKAVLGHPNALVGSETLRTVFAEVVSILNGRPLCPSSDDPNDLEPLTPSHFLLQRQNMAIPPGLFPKEDLYCRKQWRCAQFLANCFWTRWIREYIPTLQLRQKWLFKRRNLAINDLVLLVDNITPRGHWSLGRVTKVFPGADSRVRTVEVKTRNDSVLVRPVAKLCLLEESK